jgi:DNA replication protein DnaC
MPEEYGVPSDPKWRQYENISDDNVAVPIIDRIIHHSPIFMLGGESYRLKQKIGS